MSHIRTIRVRGYHCDFYGHLNHARYLELLEEARWSYLEDRMDLQDWKEKKYYMTVKYAMSHIQGDSTAIISQQSSSRRYFQRPDNDYTTFDSTRTLIKQTTRTQTRQNQRVAWDPL